jgi:hypothetical protein
MATAEATAQRSLDLFEAVCEAVGVPPGAERLDLFLTLPDRQQEQIWREIVDADGGESAP